MIKEGTLKCLKANHGVNPLAFKKAENISDFINEMYVQPLWPIVPLKNLLYFTCMIPGVWFYRTEMAMAQKRRPGIDGSLHSMITSFI